MIERNFVLHGDICYSESKNRLITKQNGYVVCKEGICEGVFKTIPEEYRHFPCHDYGKCMIVPGLSDLHVHAPQYAYRGLGMDMELLDWLERHAFPEESKYQNLEYAKKAYEIFVEDLLKGATTRTAVFATIHKEGTLLLMELMEKAGLCGYVGKVNMDRNSPDYLREESAKTAEVVTEDWILEATEKFERIKPILTPRFTPSCTDELMKGLSRIQKKYQVPLQSHLSENLSEIEWVKELCPGTECYGEAYGQFDLFGGACPTIMAHCVYSGEKEIRMMKENGVFVAHCPSSNMNVASGIAPVRRYLEEELCVGLGSDVAGGSSLSIFRAMTDAIQNSKLRWRLVDQSLKPLTIEEAFYLGTKGGGAFFGKVGSFEAGYEFDAVVLDDSSIKHPQELSLRDRLERFIYLSDDRHIVGKYIRGYAVHGIPLEKCRILS